MNGDPRRRTGPRSAPYGDGFSPFSRREFLERSGALVVFFGTVPAAAGEASESMPAAQFPRGASPDLDRWLAIGADGRVTAYTGKCELGQGMLTAQTQLVAEELSVPISHVTLVQCDTSMTPDQGTTSGSQSHPTNFNRSDLAQAAATAREALVAMAAERLQAPPSALVARDGVVSVRSDSSRRIGYGELVGGGKFNRPLSATAPRKRHAEWTLLGRPIPRRELPSLVTGEFEYVHNVRVPGMLHGRVVRPPEVGASVAAVDEASVRGMPGVVKVVVRKNFVGVVAEKPWQAVQAAGRLKVTWTPGPALPPQRTFYDHLRRQPSRDAFVVNSGNVDERLAGAARVFRATYHHPYQMHGALGTSCAVADVKADGATIWSASQAVYPLRATAASLLGVPPERVRVVFRMGSGCYGINGADTVSYDAAILSQAVGRPVRVQLTRRDEMAWENYGYPYAIDQRVGVDAQGTIVAWDYEAWFATLGGRPGYNAPGNVVSGALAGFAPAAVAPRAPAPDPSGTFANGSNAAPSYVTGTVGGRSGGTGVVAVERVLTHTVASPFFTGPLRSPSRLQNTFAHECFIDEVAAALKVDPVEYRLRHLRDPRLKDVVSAAAKAAKWETRPSPRPGLTRTGVAAGRGIACVLYEGDNGYCALVAEVRVDQASGRVTVARMAVGHDCGPISNPDGLRNQIEGGALQGMSRALGEEVTWDDRKVTSIDWRTYRTLTLGAEIPAIEIVLIDRPDTEAMGAGETSITLMAAAIGNAIFDATGVRIRTVPFTPEHTKWALEARP